MPSSELTIGQLLTTALESFKKNSSSVVPLFVGLEAAIFLLAYLTNVDILNIFMIPVVLFSQIALLKTYRSPIDKFDYAKVLDLNDSGLKDKLWRLFLTYLLIFIFILLLTVTIIGIPVAIFFGVYWYLSSYSVLDQGLSGMSALKKSKELIKGHWWKTFALFVIAIVVSIVLSSVVGLIGGQDSLVGGFLMSILSGILSIYFGYVAVAYYFNLKKS